MSKAALHMSVAAFLALPFLSFAQYLSFWITPFVLFVKVNSCCLSISQRWIKPCRYWFPLQTKKRKETDKRYIHRLLPGKRGLSAWMSPLSRRIWIRQARRGPFWAIQDTAHLNAYHDFGRRWCFAIWWWAGAWGYVMFIFIFFITFLVVISELVLPKN